METADSTFEFHDLTEEGFDKKLETAPVFEKNVVVRVSLAKGGEIVKTVINGHLETEHTAKNGDIIITNPNGERYIPLKHIFPTRYVKLTPQNGANDFEGEWRACGKIRAIKNPWGKEISIPAPWGGLMNGDANCMLATMADDNGKILDNKDMYIIAPDEFATTYISKG